MENIFANYASDKDLIPRICRELRRINKQKRNNPINKWSKYMNRHFSKEDTHMSNKHKECPGRAQWLMPVI